MQLVQFLRPRIYLGRYKWLNDGTTETIRKIVSHVFHCQRIFCDLIVTNILALEYSREWFSDHSLKGFLPSSLILSLFLITFQPKTWEQPTYNVCLCPPLLTYPILPPKPLLSCSSLNNISKTFFSHLKKSLLSWRFKALIVFTGMYHCSYLPFLMLSWIL